MTKDKIVVNHAATDIETIMSPLFFSLVDAKKVDNVTIQNTANNTKSQKKGTTTAGYVKISCTELTL